MAGAAPLPYHAPMTAPHAPFGAFLDRLRPMPAELAAARDAAAKPLAALRAHFRLSRRDHRGDFLVAGSIGKHTATRPLPPLDILYLLPPATATAGTPAERVLELAAALGEGNDDDAASVAGGRIRIRPAVESGGAFLIPVAGRWRVCNPAAEVAALGLVDRLSDGAATRLLALLRAWRDANTVPLASFVLENLAREFAATRHGLGDAAALTEFFAWCRGFTPRRLVLPGGLDRLDIGDAWHGAAEAAYWRCVLAARHAAAGDDAAATEEWRRLLGRGFPDPRAALPPPGTRPAS